MWCVLTVWSRPMRGPGSDPAVHQTSAGPRDTVQRCLESHVCWRWVSGVSSIFVITLHVLWVCVLSLHKICWENLYKMYIFYSTSLHKGKVIPKATALRSGHSQFSHKSLTSVFQILFCLYSHFCLYLIVTATGSSSVFSDWLFKFRGSLFFACWYCSWFLIGGLSSSI